MSSLSQSMAQSLAAALSGIDLALPHLVALTRDPNLSPASIDHLSAAIVGLRDAIGQSVIAGLAASPETMRAIHSRASEVYNGDPSRAYLMALAELAGQRIQAGQHFNAKA